MAHLPLVEHEHGVALAAQGPHQPVHALLAAGPLEVHVHVEDALGLLRVGWGVVKWDVSVPSST